MEDFFKHHFDVQCNVNYNATQDNLKKAPEFMLLWTMFQAYNLTHCPFSGSNKNLFKINTLCPVIDFLSK